MSASEKKPVKSLRIFADKLIDYAGLYPPASLNLPQAFHNYIFYKQDELNWMLSKFIIPARRLAELSEIMNDIVIKDKVSLSVLGSGGKDTEEYLNNFEKDLQFVKNFFDSNSIHVSIDAFEIRLPDKMFIEESNDSLKYLMMKTAEGLYETLGKNIPVYYEAVLSQKYEHEIIRTAETIASLKNDSGYKLRTGGIEPSAFPEPEVIAFAIMTCCEYNVPMKFTAGLHHPIRHFNEEVKSNMYGFINVFAAGILAHESNLDEEELIEILTDEDPYEFIFNDEGIEWNGIKVLNEEIKLCRENFMVSYGSCSFTEPTDDLKTLELL
ncbi:MAG: hypothetical protein IT280_07250 [Ignavibacteria bacterium]|nr:hypothetical protein [Ignavibacteria bacterium]